MRCAVIVLSLAALSVAACSKSSNPAGVEFAKNPSPPPTVGIGAIGASMGGGPRMGRSQSVPAVATEGDAARDTAASMPQPINDPDKHARYEAALTLGADSI